MKLFYTPGTCSLSPHIALREAGLGFTLVRVDIKTHQLEDGSDYQAINPKGSVPALEIANGECLTEGPAIVQYIADQVPASNLAPANGTLARYRLQEWLNFIGSEVHKGFSPLFSPATVEATRASCKSRLAERLGWVDQQLAGKNYLLGDTFSVADGYLFAVTNWAGHTGVEIGHLAHLQAWRARVSARPAVQEALKAEGLSK